MKLRTSRLLLVFTALIGLAGIGHADTWDYKGHAGGQCQPFYGPAAANFYTTSYLYNAGEIQSVTCPVVRDSSYAPGAPIDASITVRSNGSTLTCGFYSYASNGNYIGGVSASTSSTVPTTLYFSLPTNLVGFAGAYTISCVLPNNSFIYNYYVGEAIDTDDYK